MSMNRAQDVIAWIDEVEDTLADPRSYVTDVGQVIRNVHIESMGCHEHGCPIHAPTDHSMRYFPTLWRSDRSLMERICEHGVGHPDPDHMSWYERTYGKEAAGTESVHGCCCCCMTIEQRETLLGPPRDQPEQ